MEDGRWSGDEPRCECELNAVLLNSSNFLMISVAVNEAQDESNVGTGVAIAAAVIVILLIFILIVFLHR
jgi:ABC-type glycerol-3-phosphate transport system permease component